MAGKVYLIAGANRGIGRGMFDHYVAQADNAIVAAVRDLSGAQGLLSVARGQATTVLITKIDSGSATDLFETAKELQAQIDHIDVFISAAGIAQLNVNEDIPVRESMEKIQVNGISLLSLAKAMHPLLRKTDHPAQFAFISAARGNLNDMQKYQYPNVGCTSSMALANAVTITLAVENGWLISICIHPGGPSMRPWIEFIAGKRLDLEAEHRKEYELSCCCDAHALTLV